MDNDMHQDELMSFSLSAEADDAAQVQRYQLVGDALRGEMSDQSFVDVSAAVRDALANENIADQVSAVSQASQQQAAEPASSWSLSSLFKPLAGMAVAASVAVVMVVTVNQQDDISVAPIASNIQQPVLQLANDQPLNNQPSEVLVADEDTKVNQRLLQQHFEFATQDTLQGRLPYVRAVSFEADK